MPRVTVVGLGPGGPELLTAETVDLIASVPTRFLRTARHPAASAVPAANSFDRLYDAAESFEEVYAGIVGALVAAAIEHAHILYAVPCSPGVAQRTLDVLPA